MYLNELDGLPSQGQGDGWILRLALKIVLEPMTDHILISEVDAFFACRTKQGRKTCALSGISWYHLTCGVIAEVSR